MGFVRMICFYFRGNRMAFHHRMITNTRPSTIYRVLGLLSLGLGVVTFIALTWLLGWHHKSLYSYMRTDDHTSVLRLHPSEVFMQRIGILFPCLDCGDTSGATPGSTKQLVSVFLLFGNGLPMSYMNNWYSAKPFIDCNILYDYSVFVLYRSISKTVDGTGTDIDDSSADVTNWINQLLSSSLEECRSKRTNVTIWTVAISSNCNFAKAVNDILIEVYFENATWYDVRTWSDNGEFKTWEKDPAAVLAETQNIGLVEQEKLSCCDDHIFFHKSHYEIFGHFFPVTNWTVASSVDYLRRLYSSQGLLRSQSRGNDSEERDESTASGSPEHGDVFSEINGTHLDAEHAVTDIYYDQNQVEALLSTDRVTLNRYLAALVRAPQCLRCDLLTHPTDSGRVIAMSLFGDDPKYTLGAIRNAQLLPVIFPGWRLWIYCERLSLPGPLGVEGGMKDSCASVPLQVTRKLEELGAEVKYTKIDGVAPMLWRFLPVEDDTVDVFISRDSDSRLTERDQAVVSAWLNKDAMFHCIRDHPSHSNFPISGGLWGARTKWLRLLLGSRSLSQLMRQYSEEYMQDMHFLSREVWPGVQPYVYCHDSFSCDKWPKSHPFPVARSNFEHIGQVFDAYSVPREGDVNILKRVPMNPVCEPDRL